MRKRKRQNVRVREASAGGKRGEGVKQQSLELRANYCNCNLDSKRRDTAVTASRRQQHTHTKQTKDSVCVRLYMLC